MNPQFIDTHGHVQFNAFRDDADDVLQKTLAGDVWVVMPGTQIDTSTRAVELAEKYETGVYAAIGLHPIHLENMMVDEDEVGNQAAFRTREEIFMREDYEKLLSSKKVVAMGEIGLDYWRRPKSKTKRAEYQQRQKDALLTQMDLACDYKLPVLFHCRVALDDLLEILATHRLTKTVSPPGLIHCYTGTVEQAKKFVGLGYYIAVNAGIVHKLDLADVVKEVPLERVVLETDSPYLAPPQIGDTRNEPLNVRYAAEYISQIKNISMETVAKITTQNARDVLHI